MWAGHHPQVMAIPSNQTRTHEHVPGKRKGRPAGPQVIDRFDGTAHMNTFDFELHGHPDQPHGHRKIAIAADVRKVDALVEILKTSLFLIAGHLTVTPPIFLQAEALTCFRSKS
jgi:hypothetical protein